ncbi:hypothetical protein QPK87_06000 [Kamptonema cortianum]|nr:hypothetical protein [Geitlerinema splendidum]MDK3156126.1 hypothetical protein [Kamptonema cortianum]
MKVKYLVGLTCVVVVIAVSLMIKFRRPVSAEVVAKQSLSAIENRDGYRLFKLIHESEINQLSLTPQKIHQLLNEVILPKEENYESRSPAVIEGDSSSSVVLGRQLYINKDGRELTISVRVFPTEGDAKCSPLVNALVFSKVDELKERRSPPKPGLETVRHWRDSIELLRPQFEAIGLAGFVQDGVRGRKFTWDSWISHCDDLLTRAKSDPVIASD